MSNANFPLIAGRSAGILVRCSPHAQPVYDGLLHKARTGNHWARLAVNGIQALVAGRLHLNNVFIKESSGIAYGNGRFTVVLPGCIATFEKRSNGDFTLWHLEADDHYFALQETGGQPGLHKAKKTDDGWKTSFIPDGKITHKEDRVVAIADRYEDPDEAADEASSTIIASPVSGGGFTVNKNGFDLHHTPGQAKIGGWKNARQAMSANNDPALHASAILLAKTMYEARNIEGVRWIAEHGGSGVLIQAMQILVTQNVTLEKHVVYLSNPTTLASAVAPLGVKLGLRPIRNLSHSAATPSEIIGGLALGTAGYIGAWQRLRQDPNYDGWKFTGDMVKETGNLKGIGGMALATGAAIGTTIGASLPATLVFAGVVIATLGKGESIAKGGAKVIETFFPKFYRKIKGKF